MMLPCTVDAQLFARPWLAWHTVSAGRFDVHYPDQLADWARFVAERLPGVDSAVGRLVGYSPPMRVQIVVEDPFDISNGFAFTLLDHPVIVFWASPPDPRESIGQFRSWGEMLAVHEYGHVAHLTRPSRNAVTRTLWELAPVDLGPIALRSPRWAIEGYATYIEGKITGTGRPHGVWRPATLRQWAIEGRLPNYAQLSSWGDFEGGAFAYLAGSAFLEWLARRYGDSTLVDIWRRLTARTNRSFDEAFAGVYGDTPAILYDRFRAEVTADAVGIDSALARAGLVEGELVQHLARATGDPAVSRDGQHVALVLRPAGRASRVVVWSTKAEPDTSELRARERLLKRDPEDVPARRIYPAPKRPLATLVARDGRAYEDPRWFADGQRLLLWRSTRRGDGSLAPELYVWNYPRHDVRRLTSSQPVRDADPSPDGARAVALHCAGGHCDVVLVDLGTGDTRTIAAGDVLTSFARPRWSPDGRTIAVAMQRENRWRIVLLDVAGGGPRFIDPDDGANRFDPDWIGPAALVVTSDRHGTPNLERLEIGASAPAAQSLTRVTGAAIAPAVDATSGSIWFLSLHSRGYDVRRLVRPTALPNVPSPLLDSRLTPVVVIPSTSVRAFAPSHASLPHEYGLGDRTTRWLPAASVTPEGREATLGLVNADAVGRLTLLAQLAFGSGDVWRGGTIDAAWRGWRPLVRGSLFDATTSGPIVDPVFGSVLGNVTSELRGGRARVDYSHAFDVADVRAAFGFSASRLASRFGSISTTSRDLAFAELSAAVRQSSDAGSANESVFAHLAGGRTSGLGYERLLTSVVTHLGLRGLPALDVSGSYGRVSSVAPPFERFVVGGLSTSLVDGSLLTQRISMGVLPTGAVGGDRIVTYRAATSLMGVAPFYWGASGSVGADRFDRWHRVIGVDLTVDQSAVPVLGLPGARLTAGIGRSLDAPFARHTGGYLSVTLRP
jgi:WD40 repeat protein